MASLTPNDAPEIPKSRNEQEFPSRKHRLRLERVRHSSSYALARLVAEYFDDLIRIGPIRIGLDPILGFLIPGLGDFLTQVTTLPAIYCALFNLRSIPLALACVYNSLKDWLVGLFPLLGDMLDCVVRSNRANFRLLTGFVDGDPAIEEEVNGKAAVTAALIAALGLAIFGIICALRAAFGFVASLF